MANTREFADPRTPVGFVNHSGEEIPPGAVMEPDGTRDDEGRIGVVKPRADNLTAVIFNGNVAIPPGANDGYGYTYYADGDEKPGQGFSPFPFAVIAPHADDLPLPTGTQLGTAAGDWFLRVGGTGFLAVTDVRNGQVTVIPDMAGAGSAGAGEGFWALVMASANVYGDLFYEIVEAFWTGTGWAPVPYAPRTGTGRRLQTEDERPPPIPHGQAVWAVPATVVAGYAADHDFDISPWDGQLRHIFKALFAVYGIVIPNPEDCDERLLMLLNYYVCYSFAARGVCVTPAEIGAMGTTFALGA